MSAKSRNTMARASATTITFGDCAENHVGMQKLGAAAAEGLSYRELVAAKTRFEAAGFACELVDLVAKGGVEDAFEGFDEPGPAHVLVVRDGVAALLRDAPGVWGGAPNASRAMLAGALADEHGQLEPDTRALMRGRVVNKIARHNLCFADAAQEPNYEAGRGRVVAFASVPLTAAARSAIPRFFGAKTASLFAEANYYYDAAKCGIGFHGDSERRIVVALRLGAPIPLHFQWFRARAPVGRRIALVLSGGDLYAMSEKAVGFDWKRPSIPTLRHAAGAQKYLAVAGATGPDG
jgi:hypothetical protein